jgi:hypothetical protein
MIISCNKGESEVTKDESLENKTDGFTFSGYNWIVKETKNIADSRYFCLTNKNNVSLEKDGSLKLKITKIGDVWSGGELTIDSTLGFGEYSFEIYSPQGKFDANATLSFTVLNVTEEQYEGMTQTGVRFTKYSETEANNELEYFLYATDKKIAEVKTPDKPFLITAQSSFHKIGIYPDYLYFSSKSVNNFNEFKTVKQGSASGIPDDITFSPSTDNMKVIISLCLAETNEPISKNSIELILKNFKFSPAVESLTSSKLFNNKLVENK